METTLPTLITAIDVGAWLSLTPQQIERLARKNLLPSIRLPNGDLLFDPAELRGWLHTLRASGKEAPHG